jgi:4-amino-4-deoxy-L-arabinose transferase-like glycosyltransferase
VSSNALFRTHAVFLFVFMLLVRLATLTFPDLVDTTEGRYAGVAQLMLQRDDWVTPWIHLQGVDKPYLGKPPLHFWLEQISFLIFGYNNFAARLPSVISLVGIGIALWVACSALIGAQAAVISVAVLGSSCMAFFLGGSVVLDVTLTLGITLALVGFLLAERGTRFGYLFFAGMGLGVLVKGPLASVLVIGIIAPWAVLYRLSQKSWPPHLSKLPLLSGALLFLAIVVPWYIWAEIRNPGFLKYFLWNENFGRYLKTDYGDEYGNGHRQPFGAAWGMFFLAVFPWSVVISAALIGKAKRIFTRETVVAVIRDPLLLFALSWTLSSLVLLLGARQYTATYVFPSIPGFALLMATLWSRQGLHRWLSDIFVSRSLSLSALALGVTGMVGAVISYWYQAGPVLAAVAFLVSLAALIYLLKRSPRFSHYSLVLSITTLTVVVYGAASVCFNTYLSENRSSRRVLHVANQLLPREQPLRIGFPYYYPFSAAFYGPELQRKELKLRYFEETVQGAQDIDLFVVRKDRNLQRLMADCPNCKELARIGHWRIVSPSGNEGEN